MMLLERITFCPCSIPLKITMISFRRKAVKISQAITVRKLYFPRKICCLGKFSLKKTKSVVFEHVFLVCFILDALCQ